MAVSSSFLAPSVALRASREMMSAIWEGDDERARACVERGADPSFSGDAAFLACMELGNVELAGFLLDAKDARSPKKPRAKTHAARRARTESLRADPLREAALAALRDERPAFFFLIAQRDPDFSSVDHYEALLPLVDKGLSAALEKALACSPAPADSLRDLAQAASGKLPASLPCLAALAAHGANPWLPSRVFSERSDVPAAVAETLFMACSRHPAPQRAMAARAAAQMISRAARENQYGLVCLLRLHFERDNHWAEPPIDLTRRIFEQLRKTGADVGQLVDELVASCARAYSAPALKLMARIGGDEVGRRAMRESIDKGFGPRLATALIDDGVGVPAALRQELRDALAAGAQSHSPADAAALSARLLAMDEQDALRAQIEAIMPPRAARKPIAATQAAQTRPEPKAAALSAERSPKAPPKSRRL